MEIIHCNNCGYGFIPGDAKYCPRCGEKVSPKARAGSNLGNIEKEIKNDYRALRFTAALLILLGWLVIPGGLVGSVLVYKAYDKAASVLYLPPASAGLPEITGSDQPLKNPTLLDIGFWSAFLVASLGVIGGLLLIAFGQLLEVMVDIRNDTRVTSKLTRMLFVQSADRTVTNSDGGSTP